METAIFTPIVAGTPVLLGGALSSLIQLRSQRRNQLFQINLENSKREFNLGISSYRLDIWKNLG